MSCDNTFIVVILASVLMIAINDAVIIKRMKRYHKSAIKHTDYRTEYVENRINIISESLLTLNGRMASLDVEIYNLTTDKDNKDNSEKNDEKLNVESPNDIQQSKNGDFDGDEIIYSCMCFNDCDLDGGKITNGVINPDEEEKEEPEKQKEMKTYTWKRYTQDAIKNDLVNGKTYIVVGQEHNGENISTKEVVYLGRFREFDKVYYYIKKPNVNDIMEDVFNIINEED